MVTVVAGSGVGKSAFIGETAYKLLTETDKKIGMLMLEESPKKTKLRLMSLYLNKPLHLTLLGRVAEKFDFLKNVLSVLFRNDSDWKWSPEIKEDLSKAWKQVIEKKAHDNDNQLWLFSHFGSNDIDTIVNRIDAMVTGLGCEFIFLDHVSIVVSDQQNADERKALDELATKLRTLVERRNFALVIVSHLRRPGGKPHEEGGETSLADIRGTAGIGQLSDIVIGLERNGQHPDNYLKNVTKIRVLKNRFVGLTGLTSYAHYDIENGRLVEVDKEDIEALEKASAGNKDDDQDQGFTPFYGNAKDDVPIFDQSRTGERLAAE
jgi:twinkle protein